MSGGSFDYLYNAYASDGINGLLDHRKQIVLMAVALEHYPNSSLAIAGTDRILKGLDDLDELLHELLVIVELDQVWKAVERHHSADCGSDAVETAIAEYNRRFLP